MQEKLLSHGWKYAVIDARWHVAYHQHAIPDGISCKREVCLAKMEFNLDGTINPMDPVESPF